MKLHELEKNSDEVELIAEQNQQTEFKLIGRCRVHRGHILYQFNTVTLELTEAIYVAQKEIIWEDARNGIFRKKVLKEKDCIYFSALNRDNAIRKLKKAVDR